MVARRVAVVGLAWVCACGGGPDGVTVSGAFEKGPFVVGSSVAISTLDPMLRPTGAVFTGQTLDDTGRFEVHLTMVGVRPVAIEGTGFYYNEVSGGLSTAPITLRGLDEASPASGHDAFVNVVTHLAFERSDRRDRQL